MWPCHSGEPAGTISTRPQPIRTAAGWGAQKLHSANLYQLLTYLENRQAALPDGPRHEGMLLYPVVGEAFAVDVALNGFRVQARSVDLGRGWREIEGELLGAVG